MTEKRTKPTANTIGFIGGGNMGSCLMGGLIQNGHPPQKLWVSDHGKEKCHQLQKTFGIQIASSNVLLSQQADLIVLAIKPQGMKSLVTELSDALKTHRPLLLSIAAGITTQQIKNWLNQPEYPIIRAMPNTPALLGVGISGLYAPETLEEPLCLQAKQLLDTVGKTVILKDEALMDVVTALSGSGPAYFFYVIESLIEGGIQLGLPKDTAQTLALQTALGAAKMAKTRPDPITELRRQVTSPGGTTEAGLEVLEKGQLKSLFHKALKAATLKSKALSKALD